MPGVFLFDWIVLPLCGARGLLPLAGSLAVLAVLAEVADLEVLANVAKLAAVTFFAFWFLELFEELVLLVVIVALIVPFVDAYSVFRGPTGHIVEHHSTVFKYFSVYFGRCRTSRTARGSGIPDVLFFALFLAAAVRFRLRPGWTWLAMVAAPRRDHRDHGLGRRRRPTRACRRSPCGFLVPNADLIWAQLRRRSGDGPAEGPSPTLRR